MRNSKLPNDWIAGRSRNYSGKIYYFNMKTKESTWIRPTTDQTNKASPEHINKKPKNCGEKNERIGAETPEYKPVQNEPVYQRQSSRKRSLQKTEITVEENETPQMKLLREKILQSKLKKLSTKTSNTIKERELSMSNSKRSLKLKDDKATTLSSKSSCSKLAENTDAVSVSSTSFCLKPTKNDKQMAFLNDTNRNVTFTPQMRAIHEKILQKDCNRSASEKKTEMLDQKKFTADIRTKEQSQEFTKHALIETQKKQKDVTIRGSNQNSLSTVSSFLPTRQKTCLKKNIAKERMQKLRRSLITNKEKLHEIGCSVAVGKSLHKHSRSLPISQYDKNLELSNVRRNIEVGVKRLHNRKLKNILHEDNDALSDDKLQIQQDRSLTDNIITDKSIEQTNQEVLYEEMDWEPMEDEKITLEVEVVRTQLNSENYTTVTNCVPNDTGELIQSLESQGKSPLYIVIDTNVFLSNLEIVEEARDTTFTTYSRPLIVIPWTVIRELDYLKTNKSRSGKLRIKARKAISFLNEHFSSKHPRIIGQTREQVAKNKETFSLECPDDEILQCCLQIRELKKAVVLLSYDKNLCTKAMIYDILALGRNDPLEKIDHFNPSNKVVNPLTNDSVGCSLLDEELHLSDDVFEETKAVIKNFLSVVITKQLSDIYESEWKRYVIIKPPWTVVTALKCAIKHWIAAINESFQKRSLFILKELLQAFDYLPAGGRKLQEVEHILEKCNDLMITVNKDKHYDVTMQSVNSITELKKKCLKYIADINQKELYAKIGIVEDIQEQEYRAEKVLQFFKRIYNYTRDLCGLATSIEGMACSFNFDPLSPLWSYTDVKRMKSEIARKAAALTQSLNKLLEEANNSTMKYQTLLSLQQNISIFSPDIDAVTCDLTLLDVYYCVKLKEDILRIGLKQLQELDTHFCALAAHT